MKSSPRLQIDKLPQYPSQQKTFSNPLKLLVLNVFRNKGSVVFAVNNLCISNCDDCIDRSKSLTSHSVFLLSLLWTFPSFHLKKGWKMEARVQFFFTHHLCHNLWYEQIDYQHRRIDDHHHELDDQHYQLIDQHYQLADQQYQLVDQHYQLAVHCQRPNYQYWCADNADILIVIACGAVSSWFWITMMLNTERPSYSSRKIGKSWIQSNNWFLHQRLDLDGPKNRVGNRGMWLLNFKTKLINQI